MEELAFLQGLYTGFSDQLEVLAINQEGEQPGPEELAEVRRLVADAGLPFAMTVHIRQLP